MSDEAKVFQLTGMEPHYLGTRSEVLEESDLVRLTQPPQTAESYFTCHGFVFETRGTAYKKYEGKASTVTEDSIEKFTDGNGLFPTYACHRCVFKFRRPSHHLQGHLDGLIRRMGSHLEVTVLRQEDEKDPDFEGKIIEVVNRNPTSTILEIDVLPHHFGCTFTVLGRKN